MDIVLGVTGSVAAYKAAEVARLLIKAGARVQVVMSRTAERFVGKATFSALTGRAVHSEMFDSPGELHVTLSALAPTFALVPATADSLARLAQGRADDLLGATALCFGGECYVAPAMHPRMWENASTQRNVALLQSDGVHFLGPVHGELASGEWGMGRLLEPELIARRLWPRSRDLVGRRVLVTAGPTIEAIDPARSISNSSSGKMGFALAQEAARRGATVELFAGPVALSTPVGVTRHDVSSATDLLARLRQALESPADALFMAAAVADFRVANPSEQKLKRSGPRVLKLVENPDVIRTLAAERRDNCPMMVAFALETGTDAEVIDRARAKLKKKGVEAIVANAARDSLGSDTNRVTLIREAGFETWPTQPKSDVAKRLLQELLPPLPAAENES